MIFKCVILAAVKLPIILTEGATHYRELWVANTHMYRNNHYEPGGIRWSTNSLALQCKNLYWWGLWFYWHTYAWHVFSCKDVHAPFQKVAGYFTYSVFCQACWMNLQAANHINSHVTCLNRGCCRLSEWEPCAPVTEIIFYLWCHISAHITPIRTSFKSIGPTAPFGPCA